MKQFGEVRKTAWGPTGIGLLSLVLLLQGCAQQGYSVLALTTTIIGVEVSQNPANQTPQRSWGTTAVNLLLSPLTVTLGKKPEILLKGQRIRRTS